MAIKDVTADKIEITSCISRMFSISAATFRAIKPNKIKALIKITKNKFRGNYRENGKSSMQQAQSKG